MRSSVSSGRFTSGQQDLYIEGRYRITRRPVVYCHGASGSGYPTANTSVDPIIKAIAREGFTVLVPYIALLWSNATKDTRIADALTWGRANLACSSADPLVVGVSMGGGAALHYAANHATAGVVGIIPAIDYQAIRVADTSGLRAGIDTAAGVTYPAALPAGFNPSTLTASLTTTPIQLWTASNDAVSANAATFATAVGADLHDVGALGHTDAAIAAADIPTIISFLAAHA